MKNDAIDLIREITAEHGVALDRSDPVLILQTATKRILQEALEQAEKATSEALAQHRAELELASSKWQADSRRAASQFVNEVQGAIATRVAGEIDRATSVATTRIAHALDAHEKALARSSLVCALAAGITVLGSAIVVVVSLLP
jgi:transcriptional activator TraM